MKKLPIMAVIGGAVVALLLAGAMFATGASANLADDADVDTINIVDATWTLVSWSDAADVPEHKITLRVEGAGESQAGTHDNAVVSGNAGCNAYSGPADVGTTTFSVSDLAMTMMFCMDTQDAETTYIGLLQSATYWEISSGVLTLTDGTTEVLRFEK